MSAVLLVFINPAEYFKSDNPSRGLVQFAKSMRAHYRSKDLNVKIVDGNKTADKNFIFDAGLGELPLIPNAFGIDDFPSLMLVLKNGETVWKHSGAARAYTIAFAVEAALGEPDYRADRGRASWNPFFNHAANVSNDDGTGGIDTIGYSDALTAAEKTGLNRDCVYYIHNQNDFDVVKNKTFRPGDIIYFARGKIFTGMFMPSGSGTAENPIRIRSFGFGPRPVINALREPGSIVLFNTEGWEIDGIDVTGGRHWGIFIGSDYTDLRVFSHFTIKNCAAYDIGYEPAATKMEAYTGSICVNVHDVRTGITASVQWKNVLIDNCEARHSLRSEGIIVCGAFGVSSRSENIAIQNCFVHDVGFDGILVLCGKNVLLRDNVAYHTGLSPVDVGYSPNSIWTWRCTDALVTGNEASFAHSPIHNTDGGAFDIDFYNANNTYEYNYAHDNDTYGISVFGAAYEGGTAEPGEEATSNTIVRYNYFGNNQAVGWGEVYFLTWNGGTVDGFEFYKNFIYSNPADREQPAITFPEVAYTGSLPRVFRENIIYSSSGHFMNIKSTEGLVFDNNNYYSDAARLKWHWAGSDYASFSEFKEKTGQEKEGTFTQGKPADIPL